MLTKVRIFFLIRKQSKVTINCSSRINNKYTRIRLIKGKHLHRKLWERLLIKMLVKKGLIFKQIKTFRKRLYLINLQIKPPLGNIEEVKLMVIFKVILLLTATK